MQVNDDELYSTVFNALRHGVRRKILRILSKKKVSFTNLLTELEISSSHLTYHLDSLGELIVKDDSLYTLSVFGKAAVDMMKNVEDPPRRYYQDNSGTVYKYVSVMLLTLFVISSALIINLAEIEASQQNMLETQSAEIESLTKELKPLLIFHELDSMVTSNPELKVASTLVLNYPSSSTNPYDESVMLLYLPSNNRVLEIEIMTTLPNNLILPLTIQRGNALQNESAITAPEEYRYNESVQWMSEIVWGTTMSDSRTFNVMLSEKGWYTISLTGPVVISKDGNPIIQPLQDETSPWNTLEDIRVWGSCRLLFGRTPVSFGYIVPSEEISVVQTRE